MLEFERTYLNVVLEVGLLPERTYYPPVVLDFGRTYVPNVVLEVGLLLDTL